ncbi:MAG: 4Fe-4S dicluster domain-containing protein [Spirochaetota bacterium]|nr:MAG: 4Fe-4S dicluster domain-containing protein [Spirochaetota bacterium]
MMKAVVSLEELKKSPGYPSEERFKRGPVPVIECVEDIPCNPCELACDRNLISVGKPITNLPRLVDPDALCGGCNKCIIVCPGLVIFIVDKTYSDTEASITLPYEFKPLPKIGDKIMGLNRTGEIVCKGTVHKVQTHKSFNHTNIVTIIVPKEFADDVRFFKAR